MTPDGSFPSTGNLPAPLSPLIGREREVAEVSDLLRHPETRLLTLTGPGGVGKTRLALAAAATVGDAFPDGVWFVALAAVTDPALVPSAVATALGVREVGDQLLVDRLRAALRDQRLLLVLDNFEQVVAAAPDVAQLLTGCPALTVLVTSRMRLRLSGEHEFAVAPLPVLVADAPAGDVEAQASAAVRLFVTRAHAVNREFALTDENQPAIAQICARLDGLPLAIELAAPWAKVLSPPELLARLDRRLPLLTGGGRDLPARQQTMRNTIAWSHDLLSPAEQALFRRLAVFAGGCSLDAAEAIGQAPESPGFDVLAGLASLVDRGLVLAGEGWDGAARYAMLETVREFAQEQLAASGEESIVAERHAAWYHNLLGRAAHGAFYYVWARDAEVRARNPDRAAANRLIEQDHDNLRAALDRFAATGQAASCLHLTTACVPFWHAMGHIHEAQMRLDRALAMVGAAPTIARAEALVLAADIAITRGDLEYAAVRSQEALAAWSALGDERGQALAIMNLAMVEENRLHWLAATRLFETALAVWRDLEESNQAGNALLLLGGIAYAQGQLDRAASLVDNATTRYRATGDPVGLAMANWYLGLFATAQEALLKAARYFRTNLTMLIALGDLKYLFKPLVGLADDAARFGDFEAAARLLGAVDRLLQRTGEHLFPFDRPGYERATAAARAALGEQPFLALHDAGSRLSLHDLLAEAEAIVALAEEAAATPRRWGAPSSGLTARELDVLRLVAEGKTDRTIAELLFISRRTVSSHVASILGQLGVHSRHDAVARARDMGLLPAGTAIGDGGRS